MKVFIKENWLLGTVSMAIHGHWYLWQLWKQVMVFTIIFICTSQKRKFFFYTPHFYASKTEKFIYEWLKKLHNYLLIQFYFRKIKTSPPLFQKVLLFGFGVFFFLLKGLLGLQKGRRMTIVWADFGFFKSLPSMDELAQDCRIIPLLATRLNYDSSLI